MSSKPKITYAVQYFDRFGDMRAPYQLMKGFFYAGWDTEFITTATLENESVDYVWDKVPLKKVSGFSKKIRLLCLSNKLLRPRTNHFIMTTVWDWHDFSLAIANHFLGSPYAVRLDTYCYKRESNRLAKFREHIRFGTGLRSANLILAETPIAYKQAKMHFNNAETLLVPSCYWLEDFEDVENRWLQANYSPLRRPIILYSGRLIKRKNVHELIAAFASLSKQYPEWQLEIRGPKQNDSYVVHLWEMIDNFGLSDRIQLLPSLHGENLYQRYREISIHALPSVGEGMPSTILQAMYFGGAIIAGNSGGVSFQLNNGECGIIHQPNDLTALTEGLDLLMSSESEREKFMSRARERFINTFTWEKYFAHIEQKFRALC